MGGENALAEFDWVDAFSNRAFHGNGCAVVYGAEDWLLEERLAYVRETGLTECTFVSPQEDGNWQIRYYLASEEIPYAGHPTIATAWSLFKRGLVKSETVLHARIGAINIAIQDGWVRIEAPIPELGRQFEPAEIAEIYGLTSDDIARKPQLISSGLSFIVTELRDQAAMDRATLNVKMLAELRAKHRLPSFCEPYLVTFSHQFEDQALTLGRLLLAPPNPKEDAFTGSASGMMAAWAHFHKLVPESFVHAQGHDLGRIGFAKLALKGAPKSLISLQISGQAHILMSGHITK